VNAQRGYSRTVAHAQMGSSQSQPAPAAASSLEVKQPCVVAMLHRAAQQHPGGVATVDGARTRTWKECENRVGRLAAALRDTLKLSANGRVGLVSLNSDRYFEVFFAVAWAGGIVVPMNIRLAPPEMVEQFNDCEAEIVLIDDAFAAAVVPVIRAKCPTIKHVVYCGNTPQSLLKLDYEQLIATHPKPCADAFRGGRDTFGLFCAFCVC